MIFGHGEKIKQVSLGILPAEECSTDRLQQQLLDNAEYSHLLTQAALFATQSVDASKGEVRHHVRSNIPEQLFSLLIASSLEKHARIRDDRILFTLSPANHVVSELLEHNLKIKQYGEDEVKYFCRVSAVELDINRTIARLYVPSISKKPQTFFHEWEEYQRAVSEHPERFSQGKNGCDFVFIVPAGQREEYLAALKEKFGEIPDNVTLEELPVTLKQLGELSETFLHKIGVSRPEKSIQQEPTTIKPISVVLDDKPYDSSAFLRREIAKDLRLPIVEIPSFDPQAKLAQYWNKHAVEWPVRAIDPTELLWVMGRTPEYLVSLYEHIADLQAYCGNDLLGTNYAVLKGKVNEFIMHAVYEMTHMDNAILTEDETRQMSFLFSPNRRRNIDPFGEKYTPGISRPDFLTLKLVNNTPKIATVVETTTHPNISISRLAAKIFATGHNAYQYPEMYTEGNFAQLTILVPKNEGYTTHLQQQLAALHNLDVDRVGLPEDTISQTFSFLITQSSLVGEILSTKGYKPVEVTIVPVNITTEAIDKFAGDFYNLYRPPLQNGQKGKTLRKLAAMLKV